MAQAKFSIRYPISFARWPQTGSRLLSQGQSRRLRLLRSVRRRWPPRLSVSETSNSNMAQMEDCFARGRCNHAAKRSCRQPTMTSLAKFLCEQHTRRFPRWNRCSQSSSSSIRTKIDISDHSNVGNPLSRHPKRMNARESRPGQSAFSPAYVHHLLAVLVAVRAEPNSICPHFQVRVHLCLFF